MRNRLWVIVGVVLGLLSMLLVQNYIKQREIQLRRELLTGREPTPVLVAVQDIKEGERVDEGMVAVQTKSADAIQPHALTSPEEAIGKIALVPIYTDEQVLDSKLERPQQVHTLSMKTPAGKRAVTIGVDVISGVGGFIHPGDFVDVLGIFTLPTPDGKQAAVTVTLLQRVLVLATGSRFSETETRRDRTEAGSADTVTLALSPQETELVLFARAQGQLQLSLRPRADALVVSDLAPMTIESLLAVILGPQLAKVGQQPPTPGVPSVEERRIEVYRGLEKEVVVLSEQRP